MTSLSVVADTVGVTQPTTSELQRWLSAIGVLTSAVNAGHDLKMLLDQIAATARNLLDLDFCGVMVPELDRRSLKIAGASGLPEEYIEHVNSGRWIRLDVDNEKGAPASRAFFTGVPCSVADVSAEPDSMWTDVAREQGYRSILAVPLRAVDGVVGTLNSYRSAARDFQPEEVEQLALLAEHATIALTSARIVDDLREQHRFIVRSEEIHERLLRVAVRSGGVSGIAAALRDLLGCEVVIRDASGELLSATTHFQSFFEDGRAERVSLGQGQSGLMRTHGRHAVFDVLLNGDVAGTVWLLDRAEGLDRLGVRAAEHASVVLALELLRQRTAAEVEQKLRGELLADLLAGTDPESRTVRDRAKLMGHDLSVHHRLLVAEARTAPDPQTTAILGLHEAEKGAQRAATQAVRSTSHLRPRPLIAAIRESVVALWPDSVAEPVGEQVIRRAFAADGSRSTSRVVTMQLSSSNGIPDSFRVAKGVLAFVATDQEAPDVLTLDDLGAVGILLQFAEAAVLQRYADRVLGAIDDYDTENGTDLVSTLRTYLDRDLDRRATATQLVVHPNTVSQRLRRIEVLSGLDLRSPRSILDARSALMLLDVARTIEDPTE